MSTDLTLVIVTAHNETAVCGPTMRPADLAVEAARARGLRVQTDIGLDARPRPPTPTSTSPRFDHWERRTLHEGDLGRVRNALVPECEGRYLAFLDADDLFSENWLAEGVAALDAAAERGEHAIAHPELNVIFDGRGRSAQHRPGLAAVHAALPLLPALLRLAVHGAARSTREIAYVTRDVPNGLSFQDFQFTIERLAAGWRHRGGKDTIIFKRRRDFSLSPRATRASRSCAPCRRWRSTRSATWAPPAGETRRTDAQVGVRSHASQPGRVRPERLDG